MSTIDKPLSLEAKNSTVSEFEALVENASAVMDSVSSLVGQLGAVATSSNMAGKYTVNTMSKLNSYSKNTKFVGKTYSSVKNSVNKTNGYSSNKSTASSNSTNSSNKSYSSHTSDVSQSKPETKLDTELYDKAVALPEAQSVSLYRDENNSSRQYGTFSGGTVFKDFNGTIDAANKSVQAISGWITLNNKSDTYAWVTNNSTTYIVPLNKISPEPVVNDFQSLFDKLKDNQCIKDELVINDTAIEQSKAATFKEVSSEAINFDSEDTIKYASGSISDLNDEKFKNGFANGTRVTNTNNEHIDAKAYVPSYKYHNVTYPQQIRQHNAEDYSTGIYNNVQAVIYDLASEVTNDGLEKLESGFNKLNSSLLCFQQPENISYTAAAQFDAPAPRGSQQPFQFYIAANAMNLNFTLKWHIDEVRALVDGSNKSYSMQDIADIAENFTRPWKSGNSIEPKLCKVILPGVQHIGYITEAQISYSGDMAGNYSTGGGVLKGQNTANSITDYFYSQIDVTFTMIIIKDISLKPKSTEEGRREMKITEDTDSTLGVLAIQNYTPDSNNKNNTEIKDNSGNQEVDATNPASSASTGTSLTDEIASSEGFDFSDMEAEPFVEPEYSFDEDENGNMLMLDNFGNVYSSEGEEDGFFKDKYGNEMFMADGYPHAIMGTDEDGDKYYWGDGEIDPETGEPPHIKAKYEEGGSDHIEEDGEILIQIGD